MLAGLPKVALAVAVGDTAPIGDADLVKLPAQRVECRGKAVGDGPCPFGFGFGCNGNSTGGHDERPSWVADGDRVVACLAGGREVRFAVDGHFRGVGKERASDAIRPEFDLRGALVGGVTPVGEGSDEDLIGRWTVGRSEHPEDRFQWTRRVRIGGYVSGAVGGRGWLGVTFVAGKPHEGGLPILASSRLGFVLDSRGVGCVRSLQVSEGVTAGRGELVFVGEGPSERVFEAVDCVPWTVQYQSMRSVAAVGRQRRHSMVGGWVVASGLSCLVSVLDGLAIVCSWRQTLVTAVVVSGVSAGWRRR